jgi:hypothetical protein
METYGTIKAKINLLREETKAGIKEFKIDTIDDPSVVIKSKMEFVIRSIYLSVSRLTDDIAIFKGDGSHLHKTLYDNLHLFLSKLEKHLGSKCSSDDPIHILDELMAEVERVENLGDHCPYCLAPK